MEFQRHDGIGCHYLHRFTYKLRGDIEMTRKHYDYLMCTFTRIFDKTQTANRYIESLEQRIAELEVKNIMKQSSNDIYAIQVNDLLQRIAELESPNYFPEPRTCEECKYYHPETCLEHKYCACNNRCSLWNYTDYYEPKEQK